MFTALGIVLPFLTMIPQIGNAFLLMHLPIMVCAVVCGGTTAAIVGFITPLLRSTMFFLPVMYPNAVGMAFELAAYGFFLGIFFKMFPKKLPYYYISLILSMLLGRVVWGTVRFLMLALDSAGAPFTFTIFINNAFVNAVPGMILQLLFIPLLTAYLQRKTDLPI